MYWFSWPITPYPSTAVGNVSELPKPFQRPPFKALLFQSLELPPIRSLRVPQGSLKILFSRKPFFSFPLSDIIMWFFPVEVFCFPKFTHCDCPYLIFKNQIGYFHHILGLFYSPLMWYLGQGQVSKPEKIRGDFCLSVLWPGWFLAYSGSIDKNHFHEWINDSR